MTQNRKVNIGGIIFAAVVVAVLAGVFFYQSSSQNKNGASGDSSEQTGSIIFDEIEYDFGVVKQSGGKVRHEFPFTYYGQLKGEHALTVVGTPTSCACTSAEVNKAFFASGEKGVLTVIFDPNLHAEPEGRFYKTASILTDPKFSEIPEVKIWAQIDLDLGPEAFELKEPHEDEVGSHDDSTEKGATQKDVPETRFQAKASVGFIDYEAEILSESDLAEYAEDFQKANIDISPEKMFVLLSLNNHQVDLSSYDLAALSELNAEKAEAWVSLSGGGGGHHVSGILVFPRTDNPENLKIAGLPAGDALLLFKPVQ